MKAWSHTLTGFWPSSSISTSLQNTVIPDPFAKYKERIALWANPSSRLIKFSFEELKVATDNFHSDWLLGKGGFGKVYRGNLDNLSNDSPWFKFDGFLVSGKVVAIKQLDDKCNLDIDKFVAEVRRICSIFGPHVILFIGYCAEGNQRLLVYRLMPFGSLYDHLHDLPPGEKPLDWERRMLIAVHATRGLLHLHESWKPPLIHQNLKSTNILLRNQYNARLSDFGNLTGVSKVTSTSGYLAPELARTGCPTCQSDIFSFSVVLLELITGRKAFDETWEEGQQSLAEWVYDLLSVSKGCTHYRQFADPNLQGQFPDEDWTIAFEIAARCLDKEPDQRPAIRPLYQDVESLYLRSVRDNTRDDTKTLAVSLGASSSGANKSSDDVTTL